MHVFVSRVGSERGVRMIVDELRLGRVLLRERDEMFNGGLLTNRTGPQSE